MQSKNSDSQRRAALVAGHADHGPTQGPIAALEAALARGGGAAEYYALGGLKLAAHDAAGAVEAYQRCLERAPRHAEAYNNLGAALIKTGRFDAAIAALETALSLRPGYLRAFANLGKALREAGRAGDAVLRLREAQALEPGYVPVLINLGDALAAAGDLTGARHTLEAAVVHAPTLAEARVSLGITELQAGHIGTALQTLRTAVSLAPDSAEAHMNLAHALFVTGDWEAAWPHFEYRFGRRTQPIDLQPPEGIQRWDGTAAPGLELWVVGEQGLGDQLHFARYAKSLNDLGMDCVLACDPRLVRLLGSGGLGPVVPFGTRAMPQARWCPAMSLPGWLGTDPTTVPLAGGYLRAEPGRVARWRELLSSSGTLCVALAWAGNPRMETGRHAGRSPPLETLEALLNVPDAKFVSLQKGAGEEQLDAVSFGAAIQRLPDLDAGPDAFLDTAAVLTCVDVLVTSDTAIAHLAGALGVPTWLCLMHEPDWRWMLAGRTTPWYESMRLFRQPARSDWHGVYAEVAAELAVYARARKP